MNTYNTNALSSDTDSDGLLDKYKVDNNLNLRLNDTTLDPDNDGLTNLEEYTTGTDSHNDDSDGDDIKDGDEVAAGSDPLDPESTPTPTKEEPLFGNLVAVMIVTATALSSIAARKRYK